MDIGKYSGNNTDHNDLPKKSGGKRVLVILGHPSSNSYGSALAEAYTEAARQAGHDVWLLRLDRLQFDPILHDGYHRVQPLEPDLRAAQDAILWAEHLSFVYPVWWGSVPALLKGFLDRVFLPGFAFRYQANSSVPNQLLKGRSAHILMTMDTSPLYFRWIFGAPGLRQMKQATLEFCGIRPIKVSSVGPILGAKPRQLEAWLGKARAFGASL